MKTFQKLLALGFATTVLMAGCAPAGGETLQLEGTSWKLVELDGQPALPNSEGSIRFEDGKAGGSTGCNGFSGEYTLDVDGSIQFGLMASTMMACEQGLMEQETTFLQALAEAAAVQVEGGSLTIVDGAGNARLVFGQSAE